ncbi:hypothetical protein D3OALGA1CA_3055 [Olavius algarvensis associated proteobacterium Delta 3]|nr:hypothetical protein D3OALGA1CA_3055 [Olavius algarvensis associated proteobacterium Delta 3]CAB5157992.1 hypothetical protein D3OALGB2SA_5237 [Olavius algarvensis associated proteobacterium Delta 3]
MEHIANASEGIELLVRKCRFEFQRTENLDYYSKKDLHEAERKYVKYCLAGLTHSKSRQTPRDD